MKHKSTVILLIVMLMASSFCMVTTVPTITSTMQSIGTPQSTYSTSADLSLPPPSILVYTEFVDDRAGEEYENTMAAINNTYGTDYQYSNLTEYAVLGVMLSGKDILLIPEQEEANTTIMKTIGLAWAPILTSFVNNGGVVILLDFGNASAPGLGLHIYNASGLMHFGPVLDKYPGGTITQLHRAVFGDALCRRIVYQPSPRSNTFAVQTTDGTIAIRDYVTHDPIGVHKTMGRGHVVFLGFDMSDPDVNYEQIVGNAIRLHNHVVFDRSQGQVYDFEFAANQELTAWVEDLLDDGFAVSRMDTFNSSLFNASDVLILGMPSFPDYYSASEIAQINTYVTNGGSIFIYSDWGSYGDDIRALANNFGYDWYRGQLWDSDDSLNHESQIVYTGDNILSHPITTNVTRVELYASDGFTTLPANAERLLVSDRDYTSTWRNGAPSALGITTMAVSRYGSGRVGVVLDSNLIDGSANSDLTPPNDYYDSNNSLLLMNTVRWLAGGGPDNQAPQISGVTRNPVSPLNGEAVTVDATVVDIDGLDSITCHFSVNSGIWYNLSMTPVGGNVYSADIGSFSETDGVDYYVRAFDSSSDMIESVSSVYHFNVANQIPTAPSLNDPGTTDDDGAINLNWTAGTDPDGFIVRYEVEMSNTSGFAVVFGRWNASLTEKDISGLSNGTYYFRVRSVDDHEAKSIWSNIESISVEIPVDLSSPEFTSLQHSPPSPVQGGSVTVKVFVTDSSGVKNVTCYYRVNSGSWLSIPMVNTIGYLYEGSIGSFLVDDEVEYYVQAFDNSTQHNIATSGTVSFQIMNQAPLAPTLYDPGTTISVSHVIVNWTTGFDLENAIDQYQLQMSISSNFSTIMLEAYTAQLSINVTDLITGTYYFRVRVLDDHHVASAWSNVESIEVILSSTSPTTTGPAFNPDILSLVFLIVSGGSVIIILSIVVAIIRQRSRKQYNL
jgi:hypothetical protein